MKPPKLTGNVITLVYIGTFAFQLHFAGQLVQPSNEEQAKALGMSPNYNEWDRVLKNQPQYKFYRTEPIKKVLAEMIELVCPSYSNKEAQCLVIKDGQFKNYTLKPKEA
jgi:hypothetical protein